MHIVSAVNVNDAYRMGMKFLSGIGDYTESRNGPVLRSPIPVTTMYSHPNQRVLFDAQRDANPFFHLFEALWMLAGRNDVATLAQFLPSFKQFSDDGITLHGAYGHRWRNHFTREHVTELDCRTSSDDNIAALGKILQRSYYSLDQLQQVIKLLTLNPNDRRAIVCMWDPKTDLGAISKDIPCNDIIKFSVTRGHLDMMVFCRSNDIIYGAYGANAVHFSFLLEYMAAMIGMPVGVYYQISADYHAYVETPYRWDKYWPLKQDRASNPYLLKVMEVYPLVNESASFDFELNNIVNALTSQKLSSLDLSQYDNTFFARVAQPMYQAFRLYRDGDTMLAAEYLLTAEDNYGSAIDWLTAGREWLMRRKLKTSTVLNPTGAPIMSFPPQPIVPQNDAEFNK